MFLQLLKSLVDFICGGKEQAQQQQQHQLQPQPPHRPPHSHQQQQQHSQKPSDHHKFEDPNQINQINEHYVRLRARANVEGDAMAKCFEQSHQAYARGDGAEAKTLSNRGKEHQRNMQDLNKQAADWIFIENNKVLQQVIMVVCETHAHVRQDSKPGEVDLHGLYVKEAIARTDQAIQEAKNRGDFELHLIVGKGLHSEGGAAKIKPAIEELMTKHRLHAELDPHNTGVLIVQINSELSRGVGADEITQRLGRKDEICLIM